MTAIDVMDVDGLWQHAVARLPRLRRLWGDAVYDRRLLRLCRLFIEHHGAAWTPPVTPPSGPVQLSLFPEEPADRAGP